MTSTAQPEAGRRFRPGLGITIAAVPALAILLSLGTWQVQRLHWKTELIATMEARSALPPVEIATAPEGDLATLDYRSARLTGTLLPVQPLRYGSSARDGEPGARLLTPVRLADGSVILVDRGFIGDGESLPPAPDVDTVAVDGVLRWRGAPSRSWFTPPASPATRRWYAYDLAAMGEAVGATLLPMSLEQGPLAVDLPNNHLGYAITWYGLAAALVGVWTALAFRAEDRSS